MNTFRTKLLVMITIGVLFLACKHQLKEEFQVDINQLDSISFLIDRSKDIALTINKRKEFLNDAYRLSVQIENDSLKSKGLIKVAYEAYKLGDSSFFKDVNSTAQEACKKVNDTFGIADTHWNFGAFYVDKIVLDSAYFHYHKANEYFQSINQSYNSARMLYNMAVIQKDIKDFTGSEILTFQAIQKFEELNRPINMYLCYNLLGVIFNEIREYNKAIYYNEKALAYLDDVENKGTYKEGSFNNLGLIYQKMNKYDESISHFEEALKNDNLKNLNINLYTRLLDNMAYSKLLRKDSIDLYPLFLRALIIRDSVGNNFGVSISKFHLSKYYLSRNDTSKAILTALESYKLADEVKNNKVILKSLRLLTEIDNKNSDQYFESYIDLNDILQDQERKQRNKFTRIRFETDEYIEETERLDTERKIVVAGSIVAVFIISLLFLIKVQRGKNKELLFDKKQQKANEEIYSLMLRQQVRLEEGKLNERNRIAEDLHDGVLGRIFGTRMGLGFLSLEGEENTLKKHKDLIEELQKIEKEIRDISHELKAECFSTEFNFIILVEDMLKSQSKIGGFEYNLFSDENISWNSINENVKINCYRVLQEAVYNVNKHANASQFEVHFKLADHVMQLSIHDNGSGFNTRKKRKGIGLKNIKIRAKNINAKFVLKSTLTKGTSLELTIPV